MKKILFLVLALSVFLLLGCKQCREKNNVSYSFSEGIIKLVSEDKETYVEFGEWPQTIKATDVIILEDAETKQMGAHVYYKGSDGFWYAKVYENGYNTNCNYSNGTQVAVKNTENPNYLYFKVEPIKWQVLNSDYNITGKALILADKILTANIPYYDVHGENRVVNGKTVYPNNYKHSTLRAFLNGLEYEYKEKDSSQEERRIFKGKGFLQTAFTSEEQEFIITSTVDNSAESTNPATNSTIWNSGENQYACENTTDKIFVLSEKEVTTESYGLATFIDKKTEVPKVRCATDYTMANFGNQSTTEGFGGWWWLRSPVYHNSNLSRDFDVEGNASLNHGVYNTSGGIVPALYVSVK